MRWIFPAQNIAVDTNGNHKFSTSRNASNEDHVVWRLHGILAEVVVSSRFAQISNSCIALTSLSSNDSMGFVLSPWKSIETNIDEIVVLKNYLNRFLPHNVWLPTFQPGAGSENMHGKLFKTNKISIHCPGLLSLTLPIWSVFICQHRIHSIGLGENTLWDQLTWLAMEDGPWIKMYSLLNMGFASQPSSFRKGWHWKKNLFTLEKKFIYTGKKN